MDCPVCKKAMITFELEQVEVDNCTSCGGIWLDAGELEILLGDSAEAKGLLASFKVDKKCREKKRKCPICLKNMEKILTGPSESALLLDKCPKGDGLWFDKGELKDVLKGGSFDKENKIVNILTAIFAD
ncbi:MAG: zf-TFIIB domain-containing protein [Planctomycetota bacterium]|jgi:Zn-finger nucleic acid-binding protein